MVLRVKCFALEKSNWPDNFTFLKGIKYIKVEQSGAMQRYNQIDLVLFPNLKRLSYYFFRVANMRYKQYDVKFPEY